MNGSHFDTSSLATLPGGGSGNQYLYAIGLDGGLIKFGRTSNPKQRLGIHLRNTGGRLLWHFVTPALRDGPSYEAERQMLRIASLRGVRAGRQEVFHGINTTLRNHNVRGIFCEACGVHPDRPLIFCDVLDLNFNRQLFCRFDTV